MTTMIETRIFLMNVGLSCFLHNPNNPQNSRMITNARTGKISSKSALRKNVGV
jgi:hypothetical protein